jgi:hypothetical protein
LAKWIEFQYNSQTVGLQGIPNTQPSQQLQEVSAKQVLKWEKGDDLWATVVLTPADQILN